jgi:hypothetical protein
MTELKELLLLKQKEVLQQIRMAEFLASDIDVAIKTNKLTKHDLLTNEEMYIVFLGMDRDDYSYEGRTGYLDLEELCNRIVMFKKQHPNYTLVKVNLIGSCESDPPLNYYDFNFQDDNGQVILLK